MMQIRRQSGQLTLMATEITKSFGFRKMEASCLEMLTPTNCIGHRTVVVLESTLIKLSCQKWVSSKSLTTRAVQSGQQIKHRAFATKVISSKILSAPLIGAQEPLTVMKIKVRGNQEEASQDST